MNIKDEAQKNIAWKSKAPFARMADNSYWTHYKGGVYQIITLAVDENSVEPVVVYKSLKYGSIWVRTLKNWEEEVEVDGKKVKRFTKGAP